MEFHRRTDRPIPAGTEAPHSHAPASHFRDKPVPPKNTAILDEWEEAEHEEFSGRMDHAQSGWNER